MNPSNSETDNFASRPSRRTFLKALGLGGLSLGTGASTLRGQIIPSPTVDSVQKPRNLIFMVSDGMNHGTLAAANHYLNLTQNTDCAWMRLYKDGLARRALMETASASSIVTDSAAASSSWGGGKRVPNGALNTNADGSTQEPIFRLARKAGKAAGLVTSARITHATPAGFVVSHPERNDEDGIAAKYLEAGMDLYLGGGFAHFDPATRTDQRDLFADFRQQGYSTVRTKSDLLKNLRQPGKLLGTFSQDNHIPFTIDLAHDRALDRLTPNLSTMVVAALERLPASPRGFVLQIEAARVDHAGHYNDPAAILHDQLEFDRCIDIVRRFAQQDGQTLVIVTTDHGTGGLHINGHGSRYNDSTRHFERIAACTHSFEWIFDSLKAAPKETSAFHDTVFQATGMKLSKDTSEALLAHFANLPNFEGNPLYHMSDILFQQAWEHFALNWTTHQHTGEAVEFAAYGPGSEAFPAWFENWQVNGLLREIFRLG